MNKSSSTPLRTAHTSHRSNPVTFDSYSLITKSRNRILSQRFPSCGPIISPMENSALPTTFHLSAVHLKSRAKRSATHGKYTSGKSKSFELPLQHSKKPKPLDIVFLLALFNSNIGSNRD